MSSNTRRGPQVGAGPGPSQLLGNNKGAQRQISISVPPARPRPPKTPAQGGQASLTSSIANLTNTIIGTGMVALPGAFVYTGWLLGTLLVAFCGITGAFGLYLLTRCANKLGGRRQSFFTVALQTIPKGARWFDLAIALKCYGVSISYLIISGQLMPQVVLSLLKAAGHEHDKIPLWLLDRNFWVTALLVLLLPLCFLRKLDSLRHTSYLSLMAVVYLVVIVVSFFISPTARASLPARGDVHAVVFSPHILAIFPVFVFAFTCAQNMLPVYNELAATDPLMHLDRAKWAIGSSIGGAAAVYVSVAVLGYLEFGSSLSDNIIAMYPSSSMFVAFGRLSVVLLTIFSYPLQVHPCRAAIHKVIWPPKQANGIELPTDDDGDGDGDEDEGDEGADRSSSERLSRGGEHRVDSDDEVDDSVDAVRSRRRDPSADREALLAHLARRSSGPEEMTPLRWVVITACLLTTSFAVALVVDDLSIVLGFVGSLGSTTISFILPGILYSSLHRDVPGDRLRRPAQCLAAWGFLVGTVALISNILKLAHSGIAVGAEAKADRLAALIDRMYPPSA
ncbi:unnamed protein product [Parajaminaea phylloscopi]